MKARTTRQRYMYGRMLLAVVFAANMLLPTIGQAQDYIFRKDGTKQKVKIVEIDTNGVFYKRWNNRSGSTVVAQWGNVDYVKYADGRTVKLSSDGAIAVKEEERPVVPSNPTPSYASSSPTSVHYDSVDRHKLYKTYYNKAHEYFDQKKYRAAIEQYKLALSYEKDPYAYYNIAAAYYNLSKYRKAIEYLGYCSTYDENLLLVSEIDGLRKDCNIRLAERQETFAEVALATLGIVATAVTCANYDYTPIYTTPSSNSVNITPPPMPPMVDIQQMVENEKQAYLAQFRADYRRYHGHDPSKEEEETAYYNYLSIRYSSSNNNSSSSSSSSSSSYTPSSSSNSHSGDKTRMTCPYCNGTGKVRKDLNPPRFGLDDPHEGEKCPECGEANYGSVRHCHVSCGHCGGKGYYYL